MVVEKESIGVSGTVASAGEGCIRIFIGGLGESVSADDLRKTFSSPQLGNVDSVEIVRTKGRSIAYLDFVSISDKGLAKLFSTYNGCMWKGGRLKLEKAKEHYLLRLKREWAEDAKLSNDSQNNKVLAVENPHPSKQLSKVLNRNSEKQIHIFFPKLRKVKPLPFKGTGKHKYSFQHIEVPPLPVHFCDCEEHSAPFEPGKCETSANHEDNCGMNDEELTLMNSIMNKIFQRENCIKSTSRTDEFAKVAFNSTIVNDGLHFDESLADQDPDEDNLIINIVAESKSSTWGPGAVPANQDLQASNTKSVQKMHTIQGKSLLSSKKRKEPHFKDSNTNDTSSIAAEKKAKILNCSDSFELIPGSQPTVQRSDIPNSSYNPVQSQKSAFRNLVSDRDNASFRISDITSVTGPRVEAPSKSSTSDVHCTVVKEHHNTEPFQPVEENRSAEVVSNVPNAEINKSSGGTSWFQKSSWMQLVGSSAATSFSISQILPGLYVEKQEELPHKVTDSSVPIFSEVSPVADVGDQSNPVTKRQEARAVNDASTAPPGKKQHPFQPKQMISGKRGIGSGGAFTFMRSASSMKEWKKTKAALSSSLKKKGNK